MILQTNTAVATEPTVWRHLTIHGKQAVDRALEINEWQFLDTTTRGMLLKRGSVGNPITFLNHWAGLDKNLRGTKKRSSMMNTQIMWLVREP